MPRKPLAELMASDVSRLVSGSAFIFSCRIFGAAAAFVTQILLARWMGASELGRYVLAYSWMVMLAVIPVAGYSGAAIRFVGQGLADEDHGYVRGFVRHSGRVAILGSLGIAGVAGLFLLTPAFDPSARALYAAAIIGVPFLTLIKLDAGLANAFSRFSLSFLPNNVVRPLLFLGAIVAAWAGTWVLGAELAFYLHLAAMIIVVIPVAVYTRMSMGVQLTPAPHRTEPSLWNRTALSLMVLGLFTNYFPEFTVIMIGFVLPSEAIGVYNAAFRLALLISFGLFAVDAFTAPALARHFRRGERRDLVQVVHRATVLRFVVALVAVAFFALFGRFVLGLFGPEFVVGYRVLIVLSLAQLAVAAVGPAVRLLSVSGFHNKGLTASAVALAAWLLVALYLVPAHGIIGAAVSALISLAVWSAVLRHAVRRHLRIDPLIVARDLER